MEPYKFIIYDQEGSIVTITLNRPEKLNALNDDLMYELGDALDKVQADTNVRVVIITGAGRVLTATENGYGKSTNISEYRPQGRGGQGIISIQTSKRNGQVIGALLVEESDEIMLITNGGKLVRNKYGALLKGLLHCKPCGSSMMHTYTSKKNRRYRYYVPQRENKEHAGASGLPRLPAAELESAVLDQLRSILRSPALLGDVLPRAIELDPSLDEAKVTVAMTRLDTIWDQLFPAEQTRIVKLLVEKVIVSPNDLEVRLRANGIERLVLELQPAGVAQPEEALS
jgi:hypothetical protein